MLLSIAKGINTLAAKIAVKGSETETKIEKDLSSIAKIKSEDLSGYEEILGGVPSSEVFEEFFEEALEEESVEAFEEELLKILAEMAKIVGSKSSLNKKAVKLRVLNSQLAALQGEEDSLEGLSDKQVVIQVTRDLQG